MFIANTTNSKSLGTNIVNSLSWTVHIELLILKLYAACYTLIAVSPFMSINNFRLIYFSYFHSFISYGIIFWGNSPQSIHVFILQKRILRIVTGSKCNDSCGQLFKNLRILPLQSLYIYSLAMCVVNNIHLYQTNSEVHGIGTRYGPDLCLPLTNLTKYKNGGYYCSIKIFNQLPKNIKKRSHNAQKFGLVLSKFLHTVSFYTTDEYFSRITEL